MKRRIFSLLATLVVAISVLIGVSLTANAADSDGLAGHSINLAENVTLTMYVSVAEPADDAVATITLPDGSSTTAILADTKAGDNYAFSIEVAVKDIAKDVTITIPRKDGSNLAVTDSVLAYCEQYLANPDEIEFNGLVSALTAYSDAAALYFDKANSADSVAYADFSGVADAKKGGTLPAGITHRSVTLLLESETTIRHYFQLAKGKYIENYTFFVDLDKDGVCDVNERLTPRDKTNADGTVVYYVEIQNLTPNMLDTVYTVGVTGKADGATYTYDYGVLTYAKRSYAKSDIDTKNLAAAILAYNSEAGKLKGTVTFNTDGGSAVANQTYDYGVALPIVATTAKDNAVFLGWYDEGDNLVTSIPANRTGKVSLTAKWISASTLYDASTVTQGAKHWCYNHKDTSNPADGKCDTCGYCVDNPDCTIVNAAATAKCTTCGKNQLALSTNFAGLATSKSDQGRGYAHKIIDANGKEAMLWGISSGAFYKNFNNDSNDKKFSQYATELKVFAITVEVGVPTAAQYEGIEVAPTSALEAKSAEFCYKLYSKNSKDDVFRVKDGKAYIAEDTANAITLPEGKVTKVTIVFDFTGAVAGDGVNDPYKLMLYAEDGTLVNAKELTLQSGDIGDSVYNQVLFQFRTSNYGRMLLGDISLVTANPFTNEVINATDNTKLGVYTYGTATELPTPTRDGYAFAGWYADEALTKPISEVPANAVGEFKVYAKWNTIVFATDLDSQTESKYLVNNGSSSSKYCPHVIDPSDYKDENGNCKVCAAHIHTNVKGDCDVCGYTATLCKTHTDAYKLNATKKDETISAEPDGRCDICAGLIAPAAANSQDLGIGMDKNTGQSHSSGYVLEIDGDGNYVRLVSTTGGGPGYIPKSSSGNSIYSILKDKQQKAITFSMEFAKDSDFADCLALTIRTRATDSSNDFVLFTTTDSGVVCAHNKSQLLNMTETLAKLYVTLDFDTNRIVYSNANGEVIYVISKNISDSFEKFTGVDGRILNINFGNGGNSAIRIGDISIIEGYPFD